MPLEPVSAADCSCFGVSGACEALSGRAAIHDEQTRPTRLVLLSIRAFCRLGMWPKAGESQLRSYPSRRLLAFAVVASVAAYPL